MLKELDLGFVKGNKSRLFKMTEEQKNMRIESARNKDIERAIKKNSYYEEQLKKAQLNLRSKQIKKYQQNNQRPDFSDGEAELNEVDQPFLEEEIERNDESRLNI
mgnify:CR=1 FL=1